MNKPTSGRTLQDAKRQIAQKSKEFEGRLMKARNAFEQITVLNDMTELIEAEITQWTTLISSDSDNSEKDEAQLMNDAATHVSDLSDLLETLNEHRKALLPDALKIQSAMINSHQLKAPVITAE